MQKINVADVAIEHRVSPKGKFEIFRQHVSLALGGKKDQGPWGGGHPFDIELARIPAGKTNYPLHSHAAQHEYYIIVSGTGMMVKEDQSSFRLQAGDHVMCPPGDAHQIVNDGGEDLVLLVIADHHPTEVTSYPKTGKRHIKPEYRLVRVTDVDYYEGEE